MEIMMRKPSMNTLFAGIAGLLLSTVSVAASSASGMATAGPSLGLGPVSGSAIITADIDLAAQPASIDFSVPEGAKITQVLLGWEGEGVYPSPGDENITVNGIGITGRLSGGPTIAFRSGEDQIQRSRFRADITSLALVRTGRNSLTIDGLTFNYKNERADVVVVYGEGSIIPIVEHSRQRHVPAELDN